MANQGGSLSEARLQDREHLVDSLQVNDSLGTFHVSYKDKQNTRSSLILQSSPASPWPEGLEKILRSLHF